MLQFGNGCTDEIIKEIFRNGALSLRDLSNCALVARRFLPFARQSLYSRITIRLEIVGTRQTPLYDPPSFLCVRTLGESPQLAQFVTTLGFETQAHPLGQVDEERIVHLESLLRQLFKLASKARNLAVDLDGVFGREVRRYHHVLKLRLAGLDISRATEHVPIGTGKTIVNPATLVRFAGRSLQSHAPFPRLEVVDLAVLPPRLPPSTRIRSLRTCLVQPDESRFSCLSTIAHLSLFFEPCLSPGARLHLIDHRLSSVRTLSFETDVLDSKTDMGLEPFLYSPPPLLRRVNFLDPRSIGSLVRFFAGENRVALSDLPDGAYRYNVPELGVAASLKEETDEGAQLETVRQTCLREEIELFYVPERLDVFGECIALLAFEQDLP
ncbi:hypothetical protein JCM11491_005229 [Sporobolomyces phaffii]